MAKMYYEKDCELSYLNGKKIAIIGYGSQGHAHALNLKDSGCDVCVGLRAGSKNWAEAEKAGLAVKTVAEAAQWGDIVMMLINDEVQAEVYKNDIAPYLTEGKALAFAHGFNIRYQQIVPPAGVDVFMAAPKGPGHTVRSTYVNGKGVPCLVAVEQNATGNAYKLALAYIAGIGGARAGVMETTFHDETETDLFGEQTVLCGGVVDLMRCGFEVLVEAGYEPENAYFECIHEMKLIIDLINKGGVAAMNYSISDTAEFGEYVSGPRVIPHEETKARMRAVLSDIQDGTFAGKWIAENKNGRTFFNSKRAQLKKHQMELVGDELRRNMIWGGDKDLVDILCGIEWDLLSEDKRTGYDYWIGSAHHLYGKNTGKYYEIDFRPQDLHDCIYDDFDGDPLAAVEAYFAEVEKVAAMGPDILAHIDLIKKLNAAGEFFDEESPRYKAAALKALNAAKEHGCLLVSFYQ